MLSKGQKQEVLVFLQKARSFTFRELVQSLKLARDERRALQQYLDELDAQKVVHRVRRGRYSVPPKQAFVSGTLTGHRDGYGFVTPDAGSSPSQDVFIPARRMGGALDRDRVLVKLEPSRQPAMRRRLGRRSRVTRSRPSKKADRFEGTVIRVLERRKAKIVGRFFAHPRFPFVVPLDRRRAREIRILPGSTQSAVQGQIVAATVLPDGIDKYSNPFGRVVAILGHLDDPGIEYKIVEHKFDLPHEFSPAALEEAAQVPDGISPEDCSSREDFRSELCFTIDGDDARDFDDAVSLKELPSGHHELAVHIADVSHYVAEGTALDDDARNRGTSVYFPDRSIPMLPPRLSSGLCSLQEGKDRLVLSVVMEIDLEGEVRATRFVEGIICSRRRLTYEAVLRVLSDAASSEARVHADLAPTLHAMAALSQVLGLKRQARGAIDFDLPESVFKLEDTRVVDIFPAERTTAHRIIEEFMLLANKVVARHLSKLARPCLYRVHEDPDVRKLEEFEALALVFGYRLENRTDGYTSASFQQLCGKLQGKPEGKFLISRMLRAFMQARYSDQNLGHFALASSCYTHFTSPIRRYPDLVVHRILKATLAERTSTEWYRSTEQKLPEIATQSSSRERNADAAEREMERMKKVQFLSDRIGDCFDASVQSVSSRGFYVELDTILAEGFVAVETMMDDEYSFREKTYSLVGRRTRRQIRPGMPTKVRLDSANPETVQLLFSLLD